MREIKFRAWDKKEERMIADKQDFIPLLVTNKGILRLFHGSKENLWQLINGERFYLMQYTGLNSANGKEIYEGDILKWVCKETGNKDIGQVIFTSGFFAVRNKYGTQSLREYLIIKNETQEVYVIGNIYENPELLEVE